MSFMESSIWDEKKRYLFDGVDIFVEEILDFEDLGEAAFPYPAPHFEVLGESLRIVKATVYITAMEEECVLSINLT